MADITYSSTCSIPSPKDVYNHPLSLFADGIMARSPKLLDRIEQKNYRSYIVAIAKYANECAPWSDETTSKLSQSVESIANIMHNKGIVMHPLEVKVVELLRCPNMDSYRDFVDCYRCLKALL